MKWIGLTGGIGSGKSFVASLLKKMGATIIDADHLAREVVKPGTPGYRAVATAFGAGIILPSGEFDRRKLGAIVFADDSARKKLENILHPRILARAAEEAQAAAAKGELAVVFDVPLLFETGWQVRMDEVWVVFVAEKVQLERLCARDGMTADEGKHRISLQGDLSEKAAQADVCIDNNGTEEATLLQVKEQWMRVLQGVLPQRAVFLERRPHE
nr:dephospho-CoA kinase [uncultured Anaeromusa sp.]